MRIIAGVFGGRRLKAEVAAATRPTSDRVREGLGSALASRHAFDDAHVLDLFAGTGALGLEALSRGARDVVAIDSDKQALRCIAENVRTLGVQDRVQTLGVDILAQPDAALARIAKLKPEPFTLVFADPPYARSAEIPKLVEALAAAGLLADGARVVLEHASDFTLALPAGFELEAAYRYGDTHATILARLT